MYYCTLINSTCHTQICQLQFCVFFFSFFSLLLLSSCYCCVWYYMLLQCLCNYNSLLLDYLIFIFVFSFFSLLFSFHSPSLLASFIYLYILRTAFTHIFILAQQTRSLSCTHLTHTHTHGRMDGRTHAIITHRTIFLSFFLFLPFAMCVRVYKRSRFRFVH